MSRVLGLGSAGADVARLQCLLGARPDGQYGYATQAAVVDYQRGHHLTPDGIVGPSVWASLALREETRTVTELGRGQLVQYWPSGWYISSPFTHMRQGWTNADGSKVKAHPHLAEDLGLRSGTPIRPPEPGRVLFAGVQQGYGGVVQVEGESGARYKYCHVRQWMVSEDDMVTPSTMIALSGGGLADPNRGWSTGPHLHFEMEIDGELVPSSEHLVYQDTPAHRAAA